MNQPGGGHGRAGAAGRRAAVDALRRGCAFLTERAGEKWIAAPCAEGPAGTVRARVLSNWLRELDSLSCAVLDEVPFPHRATRSAKPQQDAACWRWLPEVVERDGATRRRLLALHRSQLTLFRYDGCVRRPDHPGGSWLTAGWPVPGSGALRRFRLGTRLELGGGDLTDTCRFYERLALSVVAATTRGQTTDSLSVPNGEMILPAIAPTAPSRTRLRAV